MEKRKKDASVAQCLRLWLAAVSREPRDIRKAASQAGEVKR